MEGQRIVWRLGGLAMYALWCVAPAGADPVPSDATFSLERHFTSNALDSDLAIADFYTLLRGTVQHKFERPTGHVRLAAEFNVSKHDRVGIEDDRAIALSAEVYDRLTPKLELRGAISYAAVSQGDDFVIGPLHLGTRALKQTVGLAGQVGVDLSHGFALVVEASRSFEQTGASHFESDLLLPSRLDPDRARTRLSLTLGKSLGRFSTAFNAAAELAAIEPLGIPPVGVAYDLLSATGDIAYKSGTISAGISGGFQFMRAADGLFRAFRPAYKVHFAKSWGGRVELRGSLKAAFETDDTDDPLASWVRRCELEAGYHLTETLETGLGLFAQIKENLLLENRERSGGFYVEAEYARTPQVSFVVRADYANTFATILETRKKTLNVFVGVRGRL